MKRVTAAHTSREQLRGREQRASPYDPVASADDDVVEAIVVDVCEQRLSFAELRALMVGAEITPNLLHWRVGDGRVAQQSALHESQ